MEKEAWQMKCGKCGTPMEVDHEKLLWICSDCGNREEIPSSAEKKQAEDALQKGLTVSDLRSVWRRSGQDGDSIERVAAHLLCLQREIERTSSQ